MLLQCSTGRKGLVRVHAKYSAIPPKICSICVYVVHVYALKSYEVLISGWLLTQEVLANSWIAASVFAGSSILSCECSVCSGGYVFVIIIIYWGSHHCIVNSLQMFTVSNILDHWDLLLYMWLALQKPVLSPMTADLIFHYEHNSTWQISPSEQATLRGSAFVVGCFSVAQWQSVWVAWGPNGTPRSKWLVG